MGADAFCDCLFERIDIGRLKSPDRIGPDNGCKGSDPGQHVLDIGLSAQILRQSFTEDRHGRREFRLVQIRHNRSREASDIWNQRAFDAFSFDTNSHGASRADHDGKRTLVLGEALPETIDRSFELMPVTVHTRDRATRVPGTLSAGWATLDTFPVEGRLPTGDDGTLSVTEDEGRTGLDVFGDSIRSAEVGHRVPISAKLSSANQGCTMSVKRSW